MPFVLSLYTSRTNYQLAQPYNLSQVSMVLRVLISIKICKLTSDLIK